MRGIAPAFCVALFVVFWPLDLDRKKGIWAAWERVRGTRDYVR